MEVLLGALTVMRLDRVVWALAGIARRAALTPDAG
jgi:hypothetical protein